MKNILLDLSNKPELVHLASLANVLKAAVADLDYFLAGATARDLLLEQAHGINTLRNTNDLDLAIQVADWPAFEHARLAMLENGLFTPVNNVLHKLMFQGMFEVDLIPFGTIEQADRTIAWPPDGILVMNVFGFREAFENTLPVTLPGRVQLQVVSLPALMLLKLIAWQERRWQRPDADAHDIAIILRHYLDAGNQQRLYTEAAELLESPDFDYEFAGAWLLGHDIAGLLPDSARPRVRELLSTESDAKGNLNLLGDLQMEPERALGLLRHLATVFQNTRGT